MKKIMLFIAVLFVFAACTQKQANPEAQQDSVVITDTVAVDSLQIDTLVVE